MADPTVVRVDNPCLSRPAECRSLHLAAALLTDVNLPLLRYRGTSRRYGHMAAEVAAEATRVVAAAAMKLGRR